MLNNCTHKGEIQKKKWLKCHSGTREINVSEMAAGFAEIVSAAAQEGGERPTHQSRRHRRSKTRASSAAPSLSQWVAPWGGQRSGNNIRCEDQLIVAPFNWCPSLRLFACAKWSLFTTINPISQVLLIVWQVVIFLSLFSVFHPFLNGMLKSGGDMAFRRPCRGNNAVDIRWHVAAEIMSVLEFLLCCSFMLNAYRQVRLRCNLVATKSRSLLLVVFQFIMEPR